jgi:hypothetical protein
MEAVMASGLSRAGKCEGVPLELKDFVGSVPRLAWAKANGCPWDESNACGVTPPLGPGTWRCCSGRGKRITRGC